MALRSKDGNARIAIIDTRMASKSTRLYHAAPLCQKVKDRLRQAKTPNDLRTYNTMRRYRAMFEFLAWETVESTGTFSLRELQTLCRKCPLVARLLRLEDIRYGGNISQVRGNLEHIPIDLEVGVGIGQLVNFIRPHSLPNEPFVQDFLQVVLQNWNITGNATRGDDKNTLMSGICLGLSTNEDHTDGPPSATTNIGHVAHLVTPPVTPDLWVSSYTPTDSSRPKQIAQGNLTTSTAHGMVTPSAAPSKTRTHCLDTVARSLLEEFRGNVKRTPVKLDHVESSDFEYQSDNDLPDSPTICVARYDHEQRSLSFALPVEESDDGFLNCTMSEVDGGDNDVNDTQFAEDDEDSEMSDDNDEDVHDELVSICRCHIGEHIDEW